MRWSERPPVVCSRLAWLVRLQCSRDSLSVAVAHLVLVRSMSAARLIGPLILLSLASCAQHYRGSVVDRHGNPVPYARVEGHGMHHAFPLGEGLFVHSTVADATGHFDLVSEDWPSEIVAI